MSRFREFKLPRVKQQHLNRMITVAPLHLNYSLCIEYIKKWFYEKFDDDFFSFTYLDGSHVFGEVNRLTKEQIVSHSKDGKPTVSIIPQIDESYDRERIDMNLYGIDQFIDTTKIDKSFFQDPVNHKYILMKMDMTLMKFNFKVKCTSRAMQLDLFKYMKLAFRVGLSESKDVNMSYVLPYPMMLNIAADCGFEIENDRIKHPIKFLTYLNSRSFVPITYRHSNVTNQEDYYIRMEHLPVRIGLDDITKDDGTKVGHLSTDFNIEMNINVRFPGMQLYAYYTKHELRDILPGKKVYTKDSTLMMAIHLMDDPPPVNDQGWNLYIKTDWQADGPGKIDINMGELFEGELLELVNSHLKKFISPDVFINIQLYNDGYKMDTFMDWSNMMLHCDCPDPNKLVSTIAIYVDLEYLNSQRIDKIGTNAKRVDYTTPQLRYNSL